MTRRAFSIIEVLLTMVLTVFIVGSATGLYSFIAIRTADSVAQYNTINQANDLINAIETVVQQSYHCELRNVSGKDMLMCWIPLSGTDKDGDGYFESVRPDSINKMNKERFLSGEQVWFYSADATSNPSRNGQFWFRAKRTDVSVPTATGTVFDAKFNFLNDGNPRVFIPGTVTFNVNDLMNTVTVTITINDTSSRPNESLLAGVRKASVFSMRRTLFWRSTN